MLGAIGAHGSALVLGGGANMLLGTERAKGEEDRHRARWYRSMGGYDLADPAHYDLVISTEALTPLQAAEIVVAGWRAQNG